MSRSIFFLNILHHSYANLGHVIVIGIYRNKRGMAKAVAAPPGFEPGIRESKSLVLPITLQGYMTAYVSTLIISVDSTSHVSCDFPPGTDEAVESWIHNDPASVAPLALQFSV